MAGGNVKGITIEFRGETTKLDTALKTINKETRAIDQELRKVNSALKFNPTSVDLWKQKQILLKNKITETQDKLKLLKNEQKRMDAAGVDKNSKEYRNLQREIIETESKLKGFKRQLLQVGNAKLTALSQSLKQIGTIAQDAGKKLTTHLTVPLVALGTASVKAFKDVDSGLDIVTQKTGASGKELKDLHGIVKNLASDIPADFQTIGSAVGEVSTRFHLEGKELEDLSGKFVKFAKLNNTDVSTSVDKTQKALSAFGLESKDAGSLLDSLNKVGQDTGANMDSLLDGLIQNSAAFQELGLSAEQSATLMGQLETSGANSETVMQGLRKALKNATAEGVPLDQALVNLQNTINGNTEGVDGLKASYDLFGKSGDQIYAAVKNGTIDFSELGKTVTEAGNSVEDTFNNTLDPADKFKTSMNQLKIAAGEVGSSLAITLAPIVDKISEKLKQFATWWDTLSPKVQQAIVIVGLVVAALGPVVFIVGTVVSAIGTVLGLISTLTTVLPILVGAIGAISAPVLIVIGVIAALIAIGVLLYKNWDTIKAKATELWNALKSAFNNIKTTISNAWTAITANVSKAVNAVKTTVTNVFNAVKNTIKTIWTAIKTTISSVWNGIKSTISSVISSIKSTVSSTFNAVKTKVTDIWKKIKKAIEDPIKTARDTVQRVVDKIKGFFPVKIGRIMSGLKLPHFKLSGKFDLKSMSVPHVSVSWYKKGGIFDSPTIAGIGEAGPEAVVPLDKLWNKLDAIAENAGGPQVVINVAASPGMDVNQLAAEVERRLILSINRRRKV